jgi:predicted small secreted protein
MDATENKERVETQNDITPPTKGRFRFIRPFSENNEWFNKALPTILVLTLVCVVYIYLVQHHVKLLREVQILKDNNKELRSEWIAIQSDVMKKSKQSEVAQRVRIIGLYESRKPPFKLIAPVNSQ